MVKSPMNLLLGDSPCYEAALNWRNQARDGMTMTSVCSFLSNFNGHQCCLLFKWDRSKPAGTASIPFNIRHVELHMLLLLRAARIAAFVLPACVCCFRVLPSGSHRTKLPLHAYTWTNTRVYSTSPWAPRLLLMAVVLPEGESETKLTVQIWMWYLLLFLSGIPQRLNGSLFTVPLIYLFAREAACKPFTQLPLFNYIFTWRTFYSITAFYHPINLYIYTEKLVGLPNICVVYILEINEKKRVSLLT